VSQDLKKVTWAMSKSFGMIRLCK